VIISPLKRAWHFICMILNSLYLRMICTKCDWNWLAGSGEDIYSFFNISTCNFPIVTLSDPLGPLFEQTWIYIISEIFHLNMSSSGPVLLEKILNVHFYVGRAYCFAAVCRSVGLSVGASSFHSFSSHWMHIL
jgi:hypothetical protein